MISAWTHPTHTISDTPSIQFLRLRLLAIGTGMPLSVLSAASRHLLVQAEHLTSLVQDNPTLCLTVTRKRSI